MKIVRTGKLTDRQIIRIIEAFEKEWPLAGASSLSVAGVKLEIGGVEFNELKSQKRDVGAIDSFDLITEPRKIVVRFRRGVGGNKDNADVGRTASPYFDEVFIGTSVDPNKTPMASPEEVLRGVRLLNGLIGDPPSGASDSEGPLDLLNAQFSQLNQLLLEVTERVHLRQIALDEQYDERTTKLVSAKAPPSDALP